MTRRSSDVLIIGGGLQGCATALFLARAGKRVTVLERQRCGRRASGVNAGGIRMLMRAPAAYPLAMHAMDLWEDLPRILGPDLARRTEFMGGTGQIAIALDAAEMTWCQDRVAEMRALGLGQEELLDQAALRRLLPDVTEAALGGLISRRDGHGNPARTAHAFAEAARAAGAIIIEDCRVQAIAPIGGGWQAETAQGRFEAGILVNCAGAWGRDLAASLGEDLPMQVLALSMMVTGRVRHFLNPVVLGVTQPLSFKQTASGTLVIGGGVLGLPMLDEDTSFVVMDRMKGSAATLLRFFPHLHNISIMRCWTGLEGETPDGFPYIGPSTAHPGLWHVFGFCGEGFHLSPAVGETVARSLIAGSPDPMLAPFAPARIRMTPPTGEKR